MMGDIKLFSKNLIDRGNTTHSIPLIISFLIILGGPALTRSGFPYFTASLGALVWLVFYVLRFRKKEIKKWSDYVKLLGAVFLSLAVFEHSFNYAYEGFLVFVSTFTLFTICFIDRIILHAMKKFSIILNIVLVLVSVFFVVFANIQTSLAREENGKAEVLATEAVAMAKKAEREAEKSKRRVKKMPRI